MLTLYIKTGCPYCAKVLNALQGMNLQVDMKNIADGGVAEELVARGGKRQVPYLIDSDRGVEMYESGDIVEYLRKNYGVR